MNSIVVCGVLKFTIQTVLWLLSLAEDGECLLDIDWHNRLSGCNVRKRMAAREIKGNGVVIFSATHEFILHQARALDTSFTFFNLFKFIGRWQRICDNFCYKHSRRTFSEFIELFSFLSRHAPPSRCNFSENSPGNYLFIRICKLQAELTIKT